MNKLISLLYWSIPVAGFILGLRIAAALGGWL